jgi:hypothetical protein
MPHLDDLRQGHFRSDHIAFLDIFVAIFFIQNHDVRKRPDNQPLWLSAADSGTRAALRASRFALRRCRSAFSACFRRKRMSAFGRLCCKSHFTRRSSTKSASSRSANLDEEQFSKS